MHSTPRQPGVPSSGVHKTGYFGSWRKLQSRRSIGRCDSGRSGNMPIMTFLPEEVECESRGWGVCPTLSAADGGTHLLSLRRNLSDWRWRKGKGRRQTKRTQGNNILSTASISGKRAESSQAPGDTPLKDPPTGPKAHHLPLCCHPPLFCLSVPFLFLNVGAPSLRGCVPCLRETKNLCYIATFWKVKGRLLITNWFNGYKVNKTLLKQERFFTSCGNRGSFS